MQAKIPATVVTGFLGAGKTTLIRHMLMNAEGRRIALIINEFGDLGVDGEILRGCGIETCREEDIVELSNGCICCTVAEDFIPTLEMLLNRPDRPDHIVIETSGLALPQPLVRAFNWPGISTRVTVDGVVTVVDGKAVSEGRFAHDVAAVATYGSGQGAMGRRRDAHERSGGFVRHGGINSCGFTIRRSRFDDRRPALRHVGLAPINGDALDRAGGCAVAFAVGGVVRVAVAVA